MSVVARQVSAKGGIHEGVGTSISDDTMVEVVGWALLETRETVSRPAMIVGYSHLGLHSRARYSFVASIREYGTSVATGACKIGNT